MRSFLCAVYFMLLLIMEGTAAFVSRPSSVSRQPYFVPSWGTSRPKTAGVHAKTVDDEKAHRLRTAPSLGKIHLDRLGATTRMESTSLEAAAASSSSDVGQPVKIIISGAPASGKGTQCEVIKEKFGVVHLSTGDMLRAAVAAGTEVGKKAKEFMDNGKLVPDDVIIGVVSAKQRYLVLLA